MPRAASRQARWLAADRQVSCANTRLVVQQTPLRARLGIVQPNGKCGKGMASRISQGAALALVRRARVRDGEAGTQWKTRGERGRSEERRVGKECRSRWAP